MSFQYYNHNNIGLENVWLGKIRVNQYVQKNNFIVEWHAADEIDSYINFGFS